MSATPVGQQVGGHRDVTFTVRGRDCLDLLEPLWLALFDHHRDVGDAGLPTIERERSWPRRRALYEGLFQESDTFVVLAERSGEPVGYSMNHLRHAPDDSWDTSEVIGVVETLVLLPQARGDGVGTALMDTSEDELTRRGAVTMMTAVLEGNDRTREFYVRRGMTPTVTYLMRLGPRDASLGPATPAR
jgi:GNAT superfamily N-acetyltransferase